MAYEAPPYEFATVEAKWQKKWYEGKAFEPRIDPKRQKFFFTIPYPYVTGNLHVGHGRTYSNGDVIARYKRMKGLNVLWPMAFHITGTPVLAISARIREGDEGTLAQYREYVGQYEQDAKKIEALVRSFDEPWNIVNYFSGKLIQDFQRMGYSLDLTRQFTTGDREYNKFIEWQFKTYKRKGYLTQAAYPILYCVKDRNAVGEDDISAGDTDPVEVQRFTAFKFKPKDPALARAFVVSCTLRPETVFGITNMFVNPAATYVRARVDGEEWWVSKEAAEKLKLQNRKVEVLEEKSGEAFVGKTLADPLGREVPVLPGSFVDPRNASGFVHSVPAHAPFDHAAVEDARRDEKLLKAHPELKDALAKLKPVPVIAVPGYGELPAVEQVQKMGIKSARDAKGLDKATQEVYRKEFYEGKMRADPAIPKEFQGKGVGEAKESVAEWLKGQGKADTFYETSRPAVCRCTGEVVAAVLADQWFLDFNAPGWKERSREALGKMLVYPAAYRKQFEDIFAWLDKRPAARRRGLGTQLPFANEWIIESLSDSTIYMAFYTVIKKIREHKLKPEQLTEEFFDHVFLGQGSSKAVAEKLGTTPNALEEICAEFNYWYPNDLRHTSIAHISNHLSFFIFAHTGVFSPKHWPRALTLNELLIAEGSKMSKSKGNVIVLKEAAEKHGADLLRLYEVSAADFGTTLDFRTKELESLRRPFHRWWQVMHELLEARRDAPRGGEEQLKQAGAIARWMVSKFESALANATDALEGFRLRDYAFHALHQLLNGYEHFNRRASPRERALVAREIAARWAQLMAPLVPHAAEELWEKAAGEGLVSNSKWPEPRGWLVDAKAEAREDFVSQVAGDVRTVAKLVKAKAPTKAKVIVADPSKRERILDALRRAEKPEQLLPLLREETLGTFAAKRFYELKERGLPEVDEFEALGEARAWLAQELGLEVTVERETESREEKAKRALPGKPALVLS
jgi:leucyl-tRNA synthetase